MHTTPLRTRSHSTSSLTPRIRTSFQGVHGHRSESRTPRLYHYHHPYSFTHRLKSNPLLYAVADIGHPDMASVYLSQLSKPSHDLADKTVPTTHSKSPSTKPVPSRTRCLTRDQSAVSTSLLKMVGPMPEYHHQTHHNNCFYNVMSEALGQEPLLLFPDVPSIPSTTSVSSSSSRRLVAISSLKPEKSTTIPHLAASITNFSCPDTKRSQGIPDFIPNSMATNRSTSTIRNFKALTKTQPSD